MQEVLERPDISIIIPIYNLEDYLQPMLDSLMNQDLGDYKAEIFFVLNNCTDNSIWKIVNSAVEADNKKSFICNCEEQGCGPARNLGMDHANGNYIWFMDGDDWLMSDTAVKDALDVAYQENLDILLIPFASNNFDRPFFSMVWQYLMKREFIEEFRFPAIQPEEDNVFMSKVLAKAGYGWLTYQQLPTFDRPLYFYNYLREGSNMYRHIVLKEQI